MTTHWLSRQRCGLSPALDRLRQLLFLWSREHVPDSARADVRRGQRGAFVTSAPEKLTTPRATAPVNTASPASYECTVVHEMASTLSLSKQPCSRIRPGERMTGALGVAFRSAFQIREQRWHLERRRWLTGSKMVWQEGTASPLARRCAALQPACRFCSCWDPGVRLTPGWVAEDRGQRPHRCLQLQCYAAASPLVGCPTSLSYPAACSCLRSCCYCKGSIRQPRAW